MTLTDREKEQIEAMIDAGQPIPPRYKAVLFEQPHEAELIWPGKTHEVTNVVLPFQSIEQIDEPRAGTQAGAADLFAFDQGTGRQTGGWANKLIWGDNKLVLASLKNGPLRREIEALGGLKLVYIDPPFDVGADFSFDIEIGDERVTKEPSLIEEIAYRDTWGSGTASYVAMMYERLRLIHDLLADDGSIFVHLDERVGPHVRLILDEVFGTENFINAVTWRRSDAHNDVGQGAKHLGRICDNIFYFSKTAQSQILNMQFSPLPASIVEKWYRHVEEGSGRLYGRGSHVRGVLARSGWPNWTLRGVLFILLAANLT